MGRFYRVVGTPYLIWRVNQTVRHIARLKDSASIIKPVGKRLSIGIGMLAMLIVLGCGGTEQPTPAPTPISEPAPQPTSITVPSPSAAQSSTETASPARDAGSVTITVNDGTTAKYIVGERLARRSLPNDAVGETNDVTGTIVFNEDGSVASEASVLIVGVDRLGSDESRRDNFLRRSSLESSSFPDAKYAVTGAEGLAWPLPTEGSVSFKLIGDMTIRDATSSVTLDVDAQFAGDSITATASTVITFDQFDMSKPRLAFILSVEDEIRLELDIQASVQTGS